MNPVTFLRHTGLFGLLSAIVGLTTPSSQADGPFPHLTTALSRAVAAGAVMQLDDFDYAPGNSLLGVYLHSGQSHGLRTTLQAGTRYLVLATGDDDILDLDLSIESPSGTVLASDTDSEPVAVVGYTPRTSERVTLHLKNYHSRRPGFCAMLILRETGGGVFSLRELSEALGNALDLSRTAALFSTSFAEGCFCLFGGRLNHGQQTYLYDVQLEPGRYFLVSAGSEGIRDLDSLVMRQYGANDDTGRTIAEDDDVDAVAVCEYDAQSGRHYRLQHSVYDSRNRAGGFVFSCVLRQ